MIDALKRSSAERITAAIPILDTQDKIEDRDQPEWQSVLKLLLICYSHVVLIEF